MFSSTNGKSLEMNGYYATTPLMKAYKQAFVTTSGFEDGWYQVSIPAKIKGNKLQITLTGTFPAGAKVEMDDLTIQFASTIGYLKFSSTNATASGACLVAE